MTGGVKPLAGRRIVITRAAGQAGPFTRMLRAAGAEVVEFPTIEIVPPENWEGMDHAIGGLDAFDYVVFTSVNALDAFMKRLSGLGREASALAGKKIIVVGPKTAKRLEEYGLRPDITPEEFRQEGVLAALETADLAGKRFLYPRAEEAREVLPERLREMGAEVVLAVAYRTVVPKAAPEFIEGVFKGAPVSAITFTSSSTVKNFMAIMGVRAKGYLEGVCVACIGPVTAKTCEEMGLTVSVVPKDYTTDALLAGLTEYFKGQSVL